MFERRDNNYHKNNGLGLCAEPAEGTTFPQNDLYTKETLVYPVKTGTQLGSKRIANEMQSRAGHE